MQQKWIDREYQSSEYTPTERSHNRHKCDNCLQQEIAGYWQRIASTVFQVLKMAQCRDKFHDVETGWSRYHQSPIDKHSFDSKQLQNYRRHYCDGSSAKNHRRLDLFVRYIHIHPGSLLAQNKVHGYSLNWLPRHP